MGGDRRLSLRPISGDNKCNPLPPRLSRRRGIRSRMPEGAVEFSRPIPLFPLPQCVLLPHATIPLHIFEPRYRQMVNDVLDERGLIAMARFEGTAWKQDYEGKPPLREHVCVGMIVRHQKLDDGRFHILLQGVARGRIVEEPVHDPYRIACIEPTEPAAPPEPELEAIRSRLEALLADPALKTLAAVSAIHNWLSSEIPTPALVDLAGMTVSDDDETRYHLLAEPDIHARARWLTCQLESLQRTLHIAGRFGSGKSEEGIPLN